MPLFCLRLVDGLRNVAIQEIAKLVKVSEISISEKKKEKRKNTEIAEKALLCFHGNALDNNSLILSPKAVVCCWLLPTAGYSHLPQALAALISSLGYPGHVIATPNAANCSDRSLFLTRTRTASLTPVHVQPHACLTPAGHALVVGLKRFSCVVFPGQADLPVRLLHQVIGTQPWIDTDTDVRRRYSQPQSSVDPNDIRYRCHST